MLFATARVAEAVKQWREELRLNPGNEKLMNDLAWVLATSPDAALRCGNEAVKIAQEAVQISQNRNAAVLDTLAAVHAEAGQFDKAVETAQRALTLAELRGDKTLAAGLQTRLKSYQAGKPWRDERLGNR